MSEDLSFQNLIAGDYPNAYVEEIVVAASQGALAKGTILARKHLKAGTATPTATGNGVFTYTGIGNKAKKGSYILKCITAVSNAGVFSVVDPDGVRLADATVAVAYANQHLKFTIADGATDFVVGDLFTVTVIADDDTCIVYDVTVNEQAGLPYCVLAEAVTATAATTTVGIRKGLLNSDALVFQANNTIATAKDALEAIGIFTKTNVAA
jgi:hypothetical protein